MKILLTGANGLLGSNIYSYFSLFQNLIIVGTDKQNPNKSSFLIEGDLLDQNFVNKFLEEHKFDIIINTVGLPSLEQCEKFPDLAFDINVKTANYIAFAAQKNNCRLIHISTDHLFDGQKSFYNENDIPRPLNVYAKTKLEAEKIVKLNCPNSVIIRTNFYGWSPKGHGVTFGEWIFNSLRDQVPIRLFTDYYFTPIDALSLVETIKIVAESDFTGILNVVGSERCSKYGFGIALAETFGFKTNNIHAATIDNAPQLIQRQKDLSLSTDKFCNYFSYQLPKLLPGLKRFKEVLKRKELI